MKLIQHIKELEGKVQPLFLKILPHLSSALEGKSGSIVEKFEGKESQITFLPYDLFQNKRILLLIQDCNSDVNNSNLCIDNDNNKELNLFNENVLTRLGTFF